MTTHTDPRFIIDSAEAALAHLRVLDSNSAKLTEDEAQQVEAWIRILTDLSDQMVDLLDNIKAQTEVAEEVIGEILDAHSIEYAGDLRRA